MKKIIVILLVLLLVLSSVSFGESDSINELVNEEYVLNIKPLIKDGLTLVPLRETLEYIDLEVTWDEINRMVTGTNKDTLVKLQIGSPNSLVNDKLVILDVPPVIINGRTMVPAGFIGELSLGKVKWDEDKNILVPTAENKDLGDIISIIEYGTNGLIAAHYPKFSKKDIDAITKDLVNQAIEDFRNNMNSTPHNKDYKYELSIDYDTYKGPSNIISISFIIIEDGSYLAHPDSKIITKVYDLSSDTEVGLENIMSGNYLKHLAQISKSYFTSNDTYKNNVDSQVFREGIYPSKDNFSNFILKEDKLLLKFEKYQLFSGNFGAPSLEIPYSDLKDYLKPDLVEAFTKEKEFIKEESKELKKSPNIISPKRFIDPSKPMIALTFDDGPNKSTTLSILDTLKKYDSLATFFILGNRVSNNESILERMVKEGNEIGNHTYNHKELTKLSNDELVEQIRKTQDIVLNSTGIELKLMRPTYGSYNDNLKAKIKMPLILWSVDPEDWKSRDSQKVTDHILAKVKDGDIVLMHDIYLSTAEAVKVLVPELINRGYQLVTVSELFESRQESLKEGQLYYRK